MLTADRRNEDSEAESGARRGDSAGPGLTT
jgi:hypothetical protein